MTQATRTVSALRQRMIDDMRMRKFAAKTQSQYIRAVSQFARFLGASPDTATAEDLRRYQLHLVDQGWTCYPDLGVLPSCVRGRPGSGRRPVLPCLAEWRRPGPWPRQKAGAFPRPPRVLTV